MPGAGMSGRIAAGVENAFAARMSRLVVAFEERRRAV